MNMRKQTWKAAVSAAVIAVSATISTLFAAPTPENTPDYFVEWVRSRSNLYVDTGVAGKVGVKAEVSFYYIQHDTYPVMLDPGLKRAIAMVSRGNGQLIVWNPGPDSAERVEDFGENGWNRFVCVEPATIPPGKLLELAPGEEHKLVMAIQSVPEGTQN